MASDAAYQHPADDEDDDRFLLMMVADELYGGEQVLGGLDLDEADGDEDASEELVPLMDLVSSEDMAISEAVQALLPVDSDDDGHYHPAPPRQQQQPHRATSEVRPLPAGSTGRALVKKQHSAKKSLKPGNPNKARDERKGELIYLRKKVSELEAQLSSVQAKRPRLSTGATTSAAAGGIVTSSSCHVCRSDPENTTECTHKQVPVVMSVWQDIANRQCEERVKAERENIRLKLVLENQLKIAKSLEKILNKKSTAKDIEEFVERNHMTAPMADATDAEMFNALLAAVDQSYFEIDAVFEANGLAQLETPLSHARMRSDSTNGMFLEIFANKLLPFDMESTGSAVWHHFAFAKEHTPFRCYTYSSSKFLHSTEDTIVENFILKLDAKGTVGNFRVKQILRRHVEQDRVVVVWRAIIEPFEFSDAPVTGVRLRESGYIVIKRPSTPSGGDYTLMKTSYIFTPNFIGDVGSGEHPTVGALTDFVLSATAANITSTHQMIENVLLEQAMKSSGRVQTL